MLDHYLGEATLSKIELDIREYNEPTGLTAHLNPSSHTCLATGRTIVSFKACLYQVYYVVAAAVVVGVGDTAISLASSE